MKTVATIKNNDERVSRRVRLGVERVSEDGAWRYTIRTGTGEDCALGSFKSRADALKAIDQSWAAAVWDLQYAS
jgi:hypothetical protein